MARSVISTNTALLCLFATLGVQALAPLAKPDPTCTTRNIPDAIASISSNNPHPTLFCSAYLHIPPNVHTTTRTDRSATTLYTSVSTITAYSYTSTATSVTLVPNTACVSGSPSPQRLAKRAFKPSVVSSACSCIYTAKTGILTTTTAVVTKPTTIKAISTTKKTVTTVTTATATVYATGTPFALKVTDYTPNPNAADQHYPDPTGDYINYDSSAGSTFDPAIQTLYALNTCNELVIADSRVNNYYILNQALVITSNANNFGDRLEFYQKSLGYQTAHCGLGADNDFACFVESDGSTLEYFGDDQGYPGIFAPDYNPYGGRTTVVVEYQS